MTQADVDAGSVTNTATAHATNPQSVAVASATSSVTVQASLATSKLSLVGGAITANYHATGDVIHYTFKLTNTGTTTLKAESITDNKATSLSCPSLHARPGGVGDLHGYLHGGAGRRGCRIGDQHGRGSCRQPACGRGHLGIVGGDGARHRAADHHQVAAEGGHPERVLQRPVGGHRRERGFPYTCYRVHRHSNPLPPNLKLSSSGAITGKPTTAGTYTITMGVTDSSGEQGHGELHHQGRSVRSRDLSV